MTADETETTGPVLSEYTKATIAAGATRRAKLDAEQRMTAMRTSLKHMTEVYAKAVELKDWETLGFPDLEAWRHHILGYTGLTKTARLEIVGALTEIGMSQREIAAATGAGVATVSRDQQVSGAPNGAQGSPRQKAARDREASRRAVVEKVATVPGLEPATEQEKAVWDAAYAPYAGADGDFHAGIATREEALRQYREEHSETGPDTEVATVPGEPVPDLAKENKELRAELKATQHELDAMQRAVSGFTRECGHDVGWHQDAEAVAALMEKRGFRWDRERGELVQIDQPEPDPGQAA